MDTDFSRFLQGKARIYILVGLALLLLLSGVLIYFLSLKPGSFPDHTVHFSQTWLRGPIGVDFVAGKFYLSNGRQIVTLDPKSGQTTTLTKEGIAFWPDFTRLIVSPDSSYVLVQSSTVDTVDKIGDIVKRRALSKDLAYWWKINLSDASVSLVVKNKGLPAQMQNHSMRFDNATNSWWGLEVEGIVSRLIKFDKDLKYVGSIRLPDNTAFAQVNGDTVYMQTENRLTQAKLTSINKVKDLVSNVDLTVFSPDSRFAFLGQPGPVDIEYNEEGDVIETETGFEQEGIVYDLVSQKELFKHGYDHYAPSWSNDSSRIYFYSTENEVERHSGITYRDLNGSEEFAIVTGDKHNGIFRILAGDKDYQLAEDNDGGTWLISPLNSKFNDFKFSDSLALTNKDADISLALDTQTGYIENKASIDSSKLIEPKPAFDKTYKLLRDNGFNPDLMNIRTFWVDNSDTPVCLQGSIDCLR